MQEKQVPAQAGAEAAVKERICPECEGKLVQRTSKFGPFFGCSNYPRCKHVEKH